MIKQILVGVAGTPALQAKIDCAIALAQRHDAEVAALAVVDVERLHNVGAVPLGGAKYAQDLADTRVRDSHVSCEEALARCESACQSANVPIRLIRQEGDPLQVLARVWRHYDLCVLGARGWFDYDVVPEPHAALLKLVSAGVRPVLAVTEGMRVVRSVLIAYHGSVESARMMKRFLQMSLWPDAHLHIVCVGPAKTQEDPQRLLAEAAYLARAHGYGTTVAQIEGVPWSALLDHAAEVDADMIALGTSGRRVLLNRRFGKNVLQLIQSYDRPLFLSN